jgi:glycosidase
MTRMTREELLRASGVAAFGLMMGGCMDGDSTSPTLAQRGGDAWGWDRSIAGSAPGCDKVAVRLNGKAVAATTSGDRFHAALQLGPGKNTVEAACGSGSGAQVVYEQKLPVRPTARIDVKVAGGKIRLDGSKSEPTQPTGAPVTGYGWTVHEGNPAPIELPDADTDSSVTFDAPTKRGEYYVTLEVADADGNKDQSTTYFVVDADGARAVDMARESPAWIESAIVYGVIPFLFGDPALKAVTKRLPYLHDLGITALWLSPITVPDVGDYGYAVVNYFKINPQYGTEADFHDLVTTAHGLGIRVLMDFVPNHSSDHHPYFIDAQKHHKASPYYDFYDRDAEGEPTHYFDWDNLPNFNYSNDDMRRFMTEAFSYWVREFDVDGFRVDAAWGVRRRDAAYWPEWRTELKRIKPDLLLLGEATALDKWYVENGFDIAYDWTRELGVWAWQDVFYDIPSLAQSLKDALTSDPVPSKVFHFLNNNDTGARFVGTYDSDTTRVAATLLLTLPGLPCVYTGDEIGAMYDPYQQTFAIDWSDNHLGLRETYTQLCHLRSQIPALHAADWEIVPITPERSGLFAYVRHLPDGSDPALVVLNFGREIFDTTLTLPAKVASAFGGTQLHDVYGDEIVPGAGGQTLKLRMTAVDARILVPASAGV